MKSPGPRADSPEQTPSDSDGLSTAHSQATPNSPPPTSSTPRSDEQCGSNDDDEINNVQCREEEEEEFCENCDNDSDISDEESERTRPCNHNTWCKEGKKRGRLVLRCMSCQVQWKTRSEFHQKCDAFYAGHCAKGAECECPHIYRRGRAAAAGIAGVQPSVRPRGGRRRNKQRRAAAAAAAAGAMTGPVPMGGSNVSVVGGVFPMSLVPQAPLHSWTNAPVAEQQPVYESTLPDGESDDEVDVDFVDPSYLAIHDMPVYHQPQQPQQQWQSHLSIAPSDDTTRAVDKQRGFELPQGLCWSSTVPPCTAYGEDEYCPYGDYCVFRPPSAWVEGKGCEEATIAEKSVSCHHDDAFGQQ